MKRIEIICWTLYWLVIATSILIYLLISIVKPNVSLMSAIGGIYIIEIVLFFYFATIPYE